MMAQLSLTPLARWGLTSGNLNQTEERQTQQHADDDTIALNSTRFVVRAGVAESTGI